MFIRKPSFVNFLYQNLGVHKRNHSNTHRGSVGDVALAVKERTGSARRRSVSLDGELNVLLI